MDKLANAWKMVVCPPAISYDPDFDLEVALPEGIKEVTRTDFDVVSTHSKV